MVANKVLHSVQLGFLLVPQFGVGVMDAMTTELSKLDALFRLLSGSKSNRLTRFRGIYSLLLGGLTFISGMQVNALPSKSLPLTSQLLGYEPRPVESGRLLPPVPSPNVSSPSSSNPAPCNNGFCRQPEGQQQPPLNPTATQRTRLNQSFLVYVNGDNPQLLAQVRQVEPGAFIRSHNGRRVIQAGLFTNQEYAQEQIIALRSQGVTAQLAVSQETRQPHLSGQRLLRAGNTLSARYGGNRQIVQPGETRDLTLTLVRSALNQAGQIVLPAGSLVRGRIVPALGGSEFVASSIQIDGAVYPLNAKSSPLSDVNPRQTSTTATPSDIAIRAAGNIVLGQVLDQRQIQLEQAAGVAIGNRPASQATVLEPNTVIMLQLTSDF